MTAACIAYREGHGSFHVPSFCLLMSGKSRQMQHMVQASWTHISAACLSAGSRACHSFLVQGLLANTGVVSGARQRACASASPQASGPFVRRGCDVTAPHLSASVPKSCRTLTRNGKAFPSWSSKQTLAGMLCCQLYLFSGLIKNLILVQNACGPGQEGRKPFVPGRRIGRIYGTAFISSMTSYQGMLKC